MAVTREEEALLEALRQKRARMKEKIISEHESTKSQSPPRTAPDISRHASVSTFHTAPSIAPSTATGKQTIFLYLDHPMPGMSGQPSVEHAEPSPVMSDFMNFESDIEDSTPRTSWAYRTMSGLPPDANASGVRPHQWALPTPPTTAPRISAVGAENGFVDEKDSTASRKKKKNNNSNVRSKLVIDSLVGEGDHLWEL